MGVIGESARDSNGRCRLVERAAILLSLLLGLASLGTAVALRSEPNAVQSVRPDVHFAQRAISELRLRERLLDWKIESMVTLRADGGISVTVASKRRVLSDPIVVDFERSLEDGMLRVVGATETNATDRVKLARSVLDSLRDSVAELRTVHGDISRALNDEPEIRYGNYGPDLLDQVTSIGEKLEGQAGFLNEWASRVRE